MSFKNFEWVSLSDFSTSKPLNWSDSNLIIWKLLVLVPVLPKMTWALRNPEE